VTARAIDVRYTMRGSRKGPRTSPARVDAELARLRPALTACYQAPDCDKTGSPWCIDSKYDANLDWEITVDEQSGAVAGIRHSGGGLQTGNCVNKALHTMSLAPYERDAGEARDTIDVVVTIR